MIGSLDRISSVSPNAPCWKGVCAFQYHDNSQGGDDGQGAQGRSPARLGLRFGSIVAQDEEVDGAAQVAPKAKPEESKGGKKRTKRREPQRQLQRESTKCTCAVSGAGQVGRAGQTMLGRPGVQGQSAVRGHLGGAGSPQFSGALSG